MKLYYFPSQLVTAIYGSKIALYTYELVLQMTDAERQTIQEVDTNAIAQFQLQSVLLYFAKRVRSLESVETAEAMSKVVEVMLKTNVDKD